MSDLLNRLPFTGPPSRSPGQGAVRLEPVSGDIQLRTPKLRFSPFGVSEKKATKDQWERLWRPTEKAPVSGVYDIVDEHGNYLHSQITCHEGDDFPVSLSHYARELDEVVEEEDSEGNTTTQRIHHYRYRLAYEARHLAKWEPKGPEAGEIYLPGDIIPFSGIYNIVDHRTGGYLQYQRACVHSKIGEPARENRFPESDGPEPGTYGYVLDYRTEHLREP